VDLDMRARGYLLVGGTSGMGLATAEVMAAEGADLVLVGRDSARAERAADTIRAAYDGARVHALVADVSRAGETERMADELDALTDFDLAGVGVFTGTAGHRPLDVTDEEWTDAFNDVLLGPTRVLRAVIPKLVERGGGTIVTVAAYGMRSPQATRIPYHALKAAVSTLTKGVAKTYGAAGVRANCVCPGAIETDGMHQLRGVIAEQRGIPYDEALEQLMAGEWAMNVAMRRPGQPREVGELVAFLLSPRAGYLTGALVNIDGGTDF
jgi:3-oxoacyl-[acyl-carrier protein] reductase